jgi:lipoprotein-anchoring transpeptidase ErfK/SrfK
MQAKISHLSLSASDSAGFLTAAMATAAGVALLAATITPARSLPLDMRPAARPQATTAPATARPLVVANSSRAKVVAKEPVDEVVAKAKAAKDPYNVIISIDKQQLTLYAGTEVIARSKVSTGVPGHPTPTGVFSVIQRDRWHRSNLYGDAPMWFMQRITWSGVAMHQGVVPGVPASHGCIRLPEAFARQMWGITQMGARVIIARSELAPSAIANPKLFVFRPEPAQPKPEPGETVASSSELVKAAYNALGADEQRTAAGPTATDAPKPIDPAVNAAANAKPLKPGPISVFVSRKEGKLFVRKGFDPVFDTPVSFEEPDQPLGTHVFTALSLKDDNATLNWMVVTVPTTTAHAQVKKVEKPKKGEVVQAAVPAQVQTTAVQALARVNIPQEARDKIEGLMSAGASLIISDQGLGPETGKGTDFIVLTR